MRIVTYGLHERVENSENIMVGSLKGSDASVSSRVRAGRGEFLAIR